MNGAMAIAASGMAAASMSLAASASNLADSQTVAPVPASGQNAAATTAAYQPVTVSNLQGMVVEPNADPATEIVNQMSAALAYKANLAAFKVAEEMQNTLINSLA